MKGIVEQYARGEFNVERPEVELSIAKLTLSVEAGTVYQGTFQVTSKNEIPIKLMAYDSRYLLDFKNHTFIGRRNTIAFSFDARGIEQGKNFKGYINIITDGGEYKIPYSIDVVSPYVMAGEKKLEDLFQFATYAEENWQAAVRLFDSPEFVRTFLTDDEIVKGVYDSLKQSQSIDQAMEEFLVYTHKKRVLTLAAKQRELLIEMPDEMVRATISINKNTWGYTHTYVVSDCDFLIPETTKITGQDFVGNHYSLDFLIDPNRIPEGVSAGHIHLKNTMQDISVKISIKKPTVRRAEPKNRHAHFMIKKGREALAVAYIDFRTDKMSLAAYIKRSTDALETLIKYMPEENLYRLGLLHMKLLAGKTEYVKQEFVRIDADADLEGAGGMEQCYYSYLKALLTKDKALTARTADMVRRRLEREQDKDRLFYFWLLLFVDERYTEDKWNLYDDIQKLYDQGVNSPVIYFEICDMFNKQPLMMKRIAPLEISAIRWGMRHEFVSEDVIMEFVKTAARMKLFDIHAFKMLETIYAGKRDRMTLDTICEIMVRFKKSDAEYHAYYRDAAEAGIKHVGLYEGFLRSMDKRTYQPIPEAILRYFNYKNTLNDDELAYLYANVIMNKAKNINVYHEYIPAIENFMEKKIVEGEVSDDLTVIYEEFLEPDSVKPEFASKLINIIFKQKLICRNRNIVSVVVTHEELEKSEKIDLIHGEAYIEIISDSAIVTLLDNAGCRYINTVPYRLEPIVDYDVYLDICREYNPKDYRLLLFEYNDMDSFSYKDAAEINLARDVANCPNISYLVKQRALRHMVEYYHENYDTDILHRYLSRIDLDYVKPDDASRIITYYISLRMYESAFDGIHRFGYVDVDVDELIRIAEFGISDKRYVGDRQLLSICVYLYRRGYATKKVLSFLMGNYNGSLEEMAELFKSVNTNYRDIDMLAENILAQMMFADGYTESIYDIFALYYQGRSRGMVVKAFLKFCAYQYIIKDLKVPSEILECLYLEINKKNITDEISKMALLSYFSGNNGRYSAEQKAWIRTTVRQFVDAGKILPFFKEFSGFVLLPDDMKFKTYLIFKGESGRQVWVSYSFGPESSSMARYRSERMNEIIPGIYIKEFVVFHGETLLYSVDGAESGSSMIVESDILKNTMGHKKSSNRFELINSMLISQETRNDKELIQAMDTYLNNTHFFEENLTLL